VQAPAVQRPSWQKIAELAISFIIAVAKLIQAIGHIH
jgi:hypothetical protein